MKVGECDQRIEQAVLGLPDRSAGATPERKVRTRGRKPNDLPWGFARTPERSN